MAAKKITKLEEDYDYDFLMAGIICSYKDYRFCFELNEAFDLAFKRQDDYLLYLGKPGATAAFSFYVAEDKYGVKYIVLSNKSIHAALIPERPAFDYFFIVKNYGAHFEFSEIMKKIKDIQMVTAIAELNPLELKSSDNLLFD